MPLAPVSKISNTLEATIDQSNRDRSVEDGPTSRLTELNRNSVNVPIANKQEIQGQVITSVLNGNSNKSPDRYIIGNSLVVTLDESTAANNNRGF